jgi:hypothetical protein
MQNSSVDSINIVIISHDPFRGSISEHEDYLEEEQGRGLMAIAQDILLCSEEIGV